ncbi:MAG: DNA repair protein RadA [Acidimicrobiaceae bacterium]|nr:DNA repair protein RadA [Acidimicrobiaceae bacterium]
MARTRTVHRCSACGASSPCWTGRCDSCGEWNTLSEESVQRDCSSSLSLAPSVGHAAGGAFGGPGNVALRIGDVADESAAVQATGLPELDRVLGGGLVAGSVTLLGGEPGIGKSTLLLQLAAKASEASRRALYVSGEESIGQIRMRADRLGATQSELWLVAATSLTEVLAHLDDVEPDLVIVDSVQTLQSPAHTSAPGSVVQVRECAHVLVQEAKRRGIAFLLVGHVTKEGALAGPRVLEHVVDTVLEFEGERHHELRLLRASKHRFGPTCEVGLMQMDESGLAPVGNPSGLFLADRVAQVSGSAVVPTVDGNRPLLVELQALVAPSSLATPRRSASGVDHGRLAMLLAVLERRVGLPLSSSEVYALAVGGAKVIDPGADAALALAVASSLTDRPLAEDLVVIGEVGLGGELRHVSHTNRRLAEASRMGFRRAIVPHASGGAPEGLTILRAPTLAAAVQLAEVGPG